MKTTLSLLMLTMLLAVPAFGKETILATITNDDTDELYTFVAETDEEFNAIKNFYKDEYENGHRTHRELLKSDGINKAGVILEKRGDNIIIALKSQNFDYQRGGTLTVDTLYNGISGQRKYYEVELAQSQDGWHIFKDKAPVSKFRIIVNRKPIVGAIGVKDIIMK